MTGAAMTGEVAGLLGGFLGAFGAQLRRNGAAFFGVFAAVFGGWRLEVWCGVVWCGVVDNLGQAKLLRAMQ